MVKKLETKKPIFQNLIMKKMFESLKKTTQQVFYLVDKKSSNPIRIIVENKKMFWLLLWNNMLSYKYKNLSNVMKTQEQNSKKEKK